MSRKTVCTLLIILNLCILAFIWLNSLLPMAVSKMISLVVKAVLGKDSTLHEIRKAAHFAEFLVLGANLFLLLRILMKNRKDRLYCLSFLAIFIPLIDETIQIFSEGRGPEVTDIWIDVGGYALGCAAAFAIILLVRSISAVARKRKAGKTKNAEK